jgi:hypothetical protein
VRHTQPATGARPGPITSHDLAVTTSRKALLDGGRPGPSIQADVLPRDGVFERLQVGEYGYPAQRRPNVVFELLNQIVPALHGPTPRHQDVQGHKAASSSLVIDSNC